MRYNDSVSADRLRELLYYNPETGVFTWRIRPNRAIREGSVAGYLRKDGFRHVGIEGTSYLAHRLAWLYVYGEWPKYELDHINRDRDDNRIANLRDMNHSRQCFNIKSEPIRKSRSGYRGVRNRWGKYQSMIKINGKPRQTGTYDTPEEARTGYMLDVARYLGEEAGNGNV